ncbi:MAG: hypothetical protein KIT17_05460 [Rubrivivax sp.]|nr:hypothetical protein [Rubrivivax sp.]
MTASPTLAAPPALTSTATSKEVGRFAGYALFALALLGAAFAALAAGTGGTALQAAYTAVNDMVGGYGKQLLTVIGFAVAAIGYMATNATGVVMKFIGFAIFLGVGLAAAVGLVGAVI